MRSLRLKVRMGGKSSPMGWAGLGSALFLVSITMTDHNNYESAHYSFSTSTINGEAH